MKMHKGGGAVLNAIACGKVSSGAFRMINKNESLSGMLQLRTPYLLGMVNGYACVFQVSCV